MALKVYNRRNWEVPKWLKELEGWALGWAFRNDSQKTPDLTHQGSHCFYTTWANLKNSEFLWIQTSELEPSLIFYVTLYKVLNLSRIKIRRSCHYSNCFSIPINWLIDLSPQCFFLIFIVIQLQLYAFSPPPLPHPQCFLEAKQSPKQLENSLCFTFIFQITHENISLAQCKLYPGP